MRSTSPVARRAASCGRFLAAACIGTLIPISTGPTVGWAELPPPHFTVAFLADQGLGADSEAVLQLVAAEGADAVLHMGDFDYDDDPQAWDAQINATLGPNFPYFAVSGNHDENRFLGAGGYQEFLEARMNRLGIGWTGDLGVMSWHRYGGISFVMTTPGVFGAGNGLHDLYIRDQFAADDSIWRVSAWHKDMRLMQVGSKPDESGWGVYEQSRKAGAIIATGHEHSYSRTHQLSDIDDQVIASTSDTLMLARDQPATGTDEGRSFVFVSGLGGESIRNQDRDGPWWAAVYTSDQAATYGALFGVFNYLNNPRRAYFYFKDIDGVIVDEFFVETSLFASSSTTTTMPPTTTTLGATTTTLPVTSTTLPSDVITARQVATGTAAAAATVATSSPLAAVAGDLYVASIASKVDTPVLAVTGLGLVWSEVIAQCSARNQTGVAVWVGQGVPSGSGVVTATLAAAPANAVIAVTRYSGADVTDPVSVVASANTNGSAGGCSGGVDGSSYALTVATNEPASLVHVAAAMRNRTHTPSGALAEQVEVRNGTLGAVASVAAANRLVVPPSVLDVGGTFDGAVDWAAAAVVVRPLVGSASTTSTMTTSTTSTTTSTTTTSSSTTSTTLPPPGLFRTQLVRVRRIDEGPGRQRGKLKSEELNASGVEFDPAVEALVFRLEANGKTLALATIDAGDPLWQLTTRGHRWKAGTDEEQARLIDIRIDSDQDLFRAFVRFANLDLSGVPMPAVMTVSLSLGNDLWSGPTPPCELSADGSALRCR